MDDWFAGSDWDSGDWDDAWDYGMEGDGGDFSDQGYDWDAVFGGGSSGGGTSGGTGGTGNWFTNLFSTTTNTQTGQREFNPWMAMLLSGTQSYLGAQRADRQSEESRAHETAMAILRDQLANQGYDRRQGQLRDAYAGYNDMASPSPNQGFNLLSGYQPRPVQQGASYYGY